MAEEIDVKIEFDDTELIKGLIDLQKGLAAVQKQLDKFGKNGDDELDNVGKKAKKATNEIDQLSKQFGKGINRIQKFAGAVGLAFGAAAIGQQITKSAQLAISYEQTTAAFETFLGSAAAARDVLAELNEFSVSTPFEPTQVIEAGQSLLAFGFEASEVTTQLERIGNISAGVNTNFNELATLFGKARVSGRLFGEDINQLTERGIPIIGELAKQFGVAESQVKKLVEQGKVSFTDLEKAFVNLTSEGGKFFGLIEKQSQTVGGRISTLQGNIDGLFRAFGERLLPAIGENVDAFNRFISRAKSFVEIPLSEKLEEERVSLNALVLQITDANIEEGKRLSLINQLNGEFPGFLEALDAQTVSNEQLSIRLNEVNEELINNIIIQQQKEKIDKAAAKASQEIQDRAKAEVEILKALTTANESLNTRVDITTGSLQNRVEAVRAALNEEARFTESIREGIKTGLNPQFDQLVKLESATNTLRGATNREADATAEVLNLEKERNEILKQLNITQKEETETTKDDTKNIKDQTAAVDDNNKAQKERAALLKELEKLTLDLAGAANEARTEGEEDARKQSELILQSQLNEINELEKTINEKAALLGKEVDISEDINTLKEQAQKDHEKRITDIIVDEFKTRAAEIEKQADEEQQSAEFVRAQQLEQLEIQKQINEAEVELLTASSSDLLTLEETKQKRLLEIQLDFQRQRLSLLAEQFGPNSKEVELLKAQIRVIESELGNIGKDDDPKDLFGNLGGKLADALGLDDDGGRGANK